MHTQNISRANNPDSRRESSEFPNVISSIMFIMIHCMVPFMLHQYYEFGARNSMAPLMLIQYYDSGDMKSMVPLMHRQYDDSGGGKAWSP